MRSALLGVPANSFQSDPDSIRPDLSLRLRPVRDRGAVRRLPRQGHAEHRFRLELSEHSGVEVSCVTCHGDQHCSASDLAKVKIPMPETCAQCHQTQVTQFRKAKHSMAWVSMKAIPTIHWQPMAMTQGEKGCGGCHKIGDKSVTEVIELREKGSGSEFGAAQCDACHTCHTFSAESHRLAKPCHMGFDHAQWEMYSAWQHGVRNDLKQKAHPSRPRRRADLPDLPHAGWQPRSAHGLGIPRGSPASARG